jgi:methylmalonyl-CoA/ethylmalonyl-CoA epimerase
VDVTALHQVALKAEDLDRATSFYRDTLGLPLIALFDPPGLAFFDLGGTRLLVDVNAPSALIYLRVPDVDAACAELRGQGVEVVAEPHAIHRDEEGQFGSPGSEEWMAFFRDSEGNLVGLVERR